MRQPQPMSGTSVCTARCAVVRLDRTDAPARWMGESVLPRLDYRRGVSPVVDHGRGACPVAGPLDDRKSLPRSPAASGGPGEVRDVTYDKDRLHGRKIGHGVSSLRNGAITLLRQLNDWSIPDAHRAMAPHPRWRSLSWERKMRTLKSPKHAFASLDIPCTECYHIFCRRAVSSVG